MSPRIITGNRFDNRDREEELRFSSEDRAAMLSFFTSSRFAWSGHRELIVRHLRREKISKPCSAGFNTLFIRHDGDVFACPVVGAPLGNVRHQPLEVLFRSDAAHRVRNQVSALPECRACSEPGMERIAWGLEGLALLEFLCRRGVGDFTRLIRHMGLDKYLDRAPRGSDPASVLPECRTDSGSVQSS